MRLSFIGLTLAACVGSGGNTREESDRVPSSYPRLRVEVDAGDIHVRPLDCDCVALDATLHWRGAPPELSWTVEDDTLVVRATCPDAHGCWTDVTVSLPPGAVVDATTGAGDITARDVGATQAVTLAGDVDVSAATGDVSLWSDAGDVTASAVAGDLSAATQAGDVVARDIAGDARLASAAGDVIATGLRSDDVFAASDAGDVDLTLDGSPTTVTASSGAGDVWILAPSGTWNLDAGTGAGDLVVRGVTHDASASRSITAWSDAGDVGIVGR